MPHPGDAIGDVAAEAPGPARDAIEASLLVELDHLVGRFADGRTPVWSGQASASDSTEENWGFGGNGGKLTVRASFPMGPALAWTEQDTSSPQSLRVAQIEARMSIFIFATPDAGKMALGIVLESNASGGHWLPCASCPDVSSTIDDTLVVDAVGDRPETGGDAPWRSTLEAELQRKPPAELNWADLVQIHAFRYDDAQDSAAFVLAGERFERRRDEKFIRSVPPAHPGMSCTEQTPYVAIQWIQPETLEAGVEIQSVGESTVECWRGHHG